MKHDGHNILNSQASEITHDMVRAYCRDTGDTQAIVADAIGYNEKTLSTQLVDHRPLHAVVIVQLTRKLRRYDAIQKLCDMCGGVFVRVSRETKRALGIDALFRAIRDVSNESADVLQRVLLAAEDGKISTKEHQDLQRKLGELILAADSARYVLDQVEVTDEQPFESIAGLPR